METALKNIVTLSVILNCSYDTAMNYLSKEINQKEWAIHFFKDIEKKEDEFIAPLPFGKFRIKIKSDYQTGILDIYLGDGKPNRSRLIEIEKNLCIYNFTLSQPKEMPNDVWKNKALPNMKDELNTLKLILESK